MIEMPAGLVTRPATTQDVDAVTSVVAACEDAADDVVDVTTEDIRSDWQRPSFDLRTDTVLVLEGERVVAYAEVFLGRAWVHVHPEVRGRGIGEDLLRWTEDHARQRGTRRLGQTVSDNDRAATALLLSNGYAVRWTTWVFQRSLQEEPVAPTFPPGISMRTFEPGRDDAATYRLIDSAFSDWPDRDPGMAFEDWAASYVGRDDFDPSLTFLLEEDGQLVGVSMGLIYDDEGWIQQLAVEREHRRRGLGSGLLQASFLEFFRRGLRTAGLSTESRTGARSLYERAGLHVTRSYARYSKDL